MWRTTKLCTRGLWVDNNMKRLVCVEYSPGKTAQVEKREKVKHSPLYGCVGETRRDLLLAALRRIKKSGQAPNPDQRFNPTALGDVKIPVRFPLIGPNSDLRFWGNKRDPEDALTLREEGVLISPYDLHLLKKKPVSFYEGRPLRNNQELFKLFESDTFVHTRSHSRFIKALADLSKEFSFGWGWKEETLAGERAPIFFGARFFGVDTVVSTYDNSVLRGVAVEVASRPWPTARQYKNHNRLLRVRRDVFLLTNTEEYISHIDGVSIGRKKTSVGSFITKYKGMTKAAKAADVRKELAKAASLIKDKKASSKPAVPVKKKTRNPSLASTTIRW